MTTHPVRDPMRPTASVQTRPSGRLHALVARNVRQLMFERRLNQMQIAANSNTSVSELGKKLNGIQGWSLLDLERLADGLDIEAAMLLRKGES